MEAPSLRLSPKKEIAASLLAKGFNQAETARDERVHVTKQTMHIWCTEDQDFIERIKELRLDPAKQADDILLAGVDKAAKTMIDIVRGDLTDPFGETVDSRIITARYNAAKYILDRTLGKRLPNTKTKEVEPVEEADDDEVEATLNFANA